MWGGAKSALAHGPETAFRGRVVDGADPMAWIRIPIVLTGLLASAATAATAAGSLGVSATVVPACTVSTETRSAAPSVTCNLAGGDIAIRSAASSHAPTASPAPADPLRTRDAARGDGVSYVTVTY